MAGRIKSLYRYGEFRECSRFLWDFFACVKTKGLSAKEAHQAMESRANERLQSIHEANFQVLFNKES